MSAPSHWTVHPRGRGEHFSQMVRLCHQCGSSPRARGTHRPVENLRRRRRFIPAGAGTTSSPACGRSGAPVHPRGRGEHSATGCAWRRFRGSSPRARGTRDSQRTCTKRQSVHPRGRGEHAGPDGAGAGIQRFIPAGAGNTPLCGRHAHPWRFIPAGAGNTDRSGCEWRLATVHPRGRGEHTSSISMKDMKNLNAHDSTETIA